MLNISRSDNVNIVYNTISEYLDQNKPFKMSEIIPYLSSRFAKASININNNGIREILTILVKQKLIVEGSQLKKNELLQFPTRKQVFLIIKNNPGCIFSYIKKQSKLNSSVIYWHLNILLKFNCIQKLMIGKHQIFFSSTTNREEAIKNYFISKKKNKQIIEYLRTNNIGITKTQLTTELGMHNSIATKHLDELEKIGIIYKEKIFDRILYFLKEISV